jgi:hypothetical protein
MTAGTCTKQPPLTVACEQCQEVTVRAQLLAKDRAGNVHHQQVLIDLPTYPAKPDPELTLLLHLGARSQTGAWFVVSIDDPAAVRTAQFLGPHAHTHRPHVCPSPPAGWLTAAIEQVPAAAGAS